MTPRLRLRPQALVLSALAAAAACADPAAPEATPQPSGAPSLARDENVDAGQPIPGQYIVVFRDAVADPEAKANEKAARFGGKKPKFVYKRALKGFAGEMSEADAAALRADVDVAYVEQDQVMYASTTQTGATWGLDRIDQASLPLSTTYSYSNTGAGVHAYIVDTGILLGHTEFAGRLGAGYDAVTTGGNATDCNGHGTHVAGTVGGTAYGVAKGATLHPVRVLDCGGSGTNAGVIAGVDWVARNAVKPAVANMSLGGGASTALDDAVRRAIAAGVTFSLAAGNGNFLGFAQDACRTSPARVARRSPSALRTRPTARPRSRTTAPAWICSPRAWASPRPGTPRRPRRTRSAVRAWRRRMSQGSRRFTCRRIRVRRPRRSRTRSSPCLARTR
jgi:subtilisin family serine protease